MSLIQLSPSNGDSLLINSGSFSTGKVIRTRNELVFYTDQYGNSTGYRWLGNLPHTINGNSPQTDGGISSTSWESYITANLYDKLKSENITLSGTAHLPTVEVSYGLPKGSLKVWTPGSTSSSSQYWLYSDGTVWGGVGTLGITPSTPFTQIHLQRDIVKYTYTVETNGTSTVYVPYTFSSVEIYVNGVLQSIEAGNFSVNSNYVLFSENLVKNDVVQFFLSNVPISSLDYATKILLASVSGASLIGTSDGKTVQETLDNSPKILGDYEDSIHTLTTTNDIITFRSVQYRISDESLLPYTTSGTTISTWTQDVINFKAQNSDIYISVLNYGAVGDYDTSTSTGTDCTNMFKAAIKDAISKGIKKVYVPGGKYLITDEINLGGENFISGEGTRDYWRGIVDGVSLVGDGPYSTILVFDPPSSDTPCISARGGWGTHSPRAVSQLAIEPKVWVDYSGTASGTGILLQGCCFVPVTDVHIGRFKRGIHLWNLLQGANDTSNTFTQGDFTEFNRFTRVRVFNSDISVDYQVTKGNNSFHGNSFADCMFQINSYGGIGLRMWDDGTRATIVPPTNAYYQYIANVYNNNFDINFFGSDARVCYLMSLIRAQGRGCAGTMTVEAAVTLKTDTFEWFQSFGSLHSISAINTSVGATDTNTRPVAFMWNNSAYPQPYFDGSDTSGTLLATSYPRQFDVNNYGNTGMDLLNVRGAQSGSIWSQLTSNVSVGWLFSTRTVDKSRAGQNTVWRFYYDGTQIKSSNTQVGLYNSTVGVNLTSAALVPSINTTINLGSASLRYNGLYINGWNMGTGGIVPVTDSSVNIGSSSYFVNRTYTKTTYYTSTVFDSAGTGSPEGIVSAGVGSTYRRTDGSSGSTFYVKESGTGNTGWVAK